MDDRPALSLYMGVACMLKKELNELIRQLKGNETAPSPEIPIKSKELIELRSVIRDNEIRLTEEKRAAEKKAAEYEQVLSDVNIMQSDRIVARQIQESMLPTAYPAFPEFPGIDLFADMDAAKETGGDFYDYFKIDDDHICFEIADVEGKGISAALYMAVAKTMIRLRLENGEPLSAVLSSVNHQLCQSSMQRRFITLWVAILEVSTGKLTFVNAGHNCPIIKSADGDAKYIRERSGLQVASYFSRKRSLPPYTEFVTTLNKGDVLLLYTDGVTEAMSRDNLLLGETRLIDMTNLYLCDGHTMKEFVSYIKRQVIGFLNGPEQSDDMTFLALKYL